MSIKYLDENGLLYVLQQIKNKYQPRVEGKGLSTCDYTPEEKEKLAGISANAEVNQNAFSNIAVADKTLQASSKTDTLTISGENGVSVATGNGSLIFSNSGVRTISEGSVAGSISVNTNGTTQSVAVHGLSSVATSGNYNDLENIPTEFTPSEHKHSVGDFTDFSDEFAKKQDVIEDLAAIRSGASLGATAQQPQTTLAGYGITDAYTKTEIDTKMSSVMRYKGTVDSKNSLPSGNNIIGDFYNTKDTGDNFAWDGEKWDAIGTAIDLSGKQDVITDLVTIRSNASVGAGLKDKVDGIASGAQVNVIESISLNSEPLEIKDKNVNLVIAQVDKAEKDSAGNIITDTYATKVSVGTPDKDKSIQDEIDDLEALVGNISVAQQITNAIINKIEESDLVAIPNLEIAELFNKLEEL